MRDCPACRVLSNERPRAGDESELNRLVAGKGEESEMDVAFRTEDCGREGKELGKKAEHGHGSGVVGMDGNRGCCA